MRAKNNKNFYLSLGVARNKKQGQIQITKLRVICYPFNEYFFGENTEK